MGNGTFIKAETNNGDRSRKEALWKVCTLCVSW